jgi:hypothetical protein
MRMGMGMDSVETLQYKILGHHDMASLPELLTVVQRLVPLAINNDNDNDNDRGIARPITMRVSSKTKICASSGSTQFVDEKGRRSSNPGSE